MTRKSSGYHMTLSIVQEAWVAIVLKQEFTEFQCLEIFRVQSVTFSLG